MEWIITALAIGAGIATTAFAAWRSGQPKKDTHKARWISWPLVTVIAGGVLMMGLVHAASLMGVHTGGNGPYRP